MNFNDNVLPACEEGIGHEHNVGRLLADSSAKAVVIPIPQHHQLRQAEGKDGAAQQAAGEDKCQEIAVIPLQGHVHMVVVGHNF